MDVTAGLPFEAVFEAGITGLVPGLELAIIDNIGNVVSAPTSVNITEQVIGGNPDSGVYAKPDCVAPADEGQYTLVWSTNGSFDADTCTVEDLVVRELGTVLPPIGIPAAGVSVGPCSAWADINQIASCCDIATDGVDPFVLIATLTSAMNAASEVLYLASGKQFAGACQRTTYPMYGDCVCGLQTLSRGYVVYPYFNQFYFGNYFNNCCSVKLPGTVREVTEVVVNGVVVDPSAYEVRERRHLVRIDGGHWPCCQRECEPRSFAVTYVYGKTPPETGARAALALACEVYKSCPISGASDCALPSGVTRITRQGITIDKSAFVTWGFMPTAHARTRPPGWNTGIAAVDLFLNMVNPAGLSRRGTVWSPSSRARYARGA